MAPARSRPPPSPLDAIAAAEAAGFTVGGDLSVTSRVSGEHPLVLSAEVSPRRMWSSLTTSAARFVLASSANCCAVKWDPVPFVPADNARRAGLRTPTSTSFLPAHSIKVSYRKTARSTPEFAHFLAR